MHLVILSFDSALLSTYDMNIYITFPDIHNFDGKLQQDLSLWLLSLWNNNLVQPLLELYTVWLI